MRNILSLILALAAGLACSTVFAAEPSGQQEEPPMVDGSIVHIEIPTTDMAASEAFYSSLFGWTTEVLMEGYNEFRTPDGVGGAFSAMVPVAAEGGPVLYIYCADIDSKLAEIEAAGGSVVVGRTPIPFVGWFAWFRDSSGNTLALFSGEDVPEGDMGMPAEG